MYVSLPMYDWPQVRAETDALWAGIRAELSLFGVAAPERLDRHSDLYAGWGRRDLLISQTCGLPFVRRLRGRVALVGAVDHGLAGIPAGMYCSRIVARRGEAGPLSAFAGRRVAYNSADSQSGAGAMRHLVLPLLHGVRGRGARFFGQAVVTGGHAASIRAVAEGRADVAAIDAMTWELARRHMPEADRLDVIASSPATPGLPLITAPDGPVDALFAAIGAALAGLPAAARDALGMQGIVPRVSADFDIVARWDAAAAGYDELGEAPA